MMRAESGGGMNPGLGCPAGATSASGWTSNNTFAGVRIFLFEGRMDTPERRQEPQSQAEIEDENRRIRRLQIMMSMVMSVICQDSTLTLEQASELVANTKRAALAMFPDKEFAYDIIYKPRLQRLMRERFRIQ
jgi:hypothetical protein